VLAVAALGATIATTNTPMAMAHVEADCARRWRARMSTFMIFSPRDIY
jgi:hypothetical protein